MLRGRKKWVSRGFEDYRRGMVVNGTNKYVDQEFLTKIQRTSMKSMSELQEILEPPKFVSQPVCVYSYIYCSEERSHLSSNSQEVLNQIVQNHKVEQWLPTVEDLVECGSPVTICIHTRLYFFPEA